jgi:hypothetical protein
VFRVQCSEVPPASLAMTSRLFSDFLRVLIFFVAIKMGTSITVPELTLCAPDGRKTCFACCPPIRPARYEHIQHKRIIERVLRENTISFRKEDRGLSPITGFSCWALGYLDDGYKRIGCLLHPFQNNGVDLRYRVDYGNKCCRESCPESKTFNTLDEPVRRFWLHLADGLDSFSYSSREENPLFRILGWGTDLLALVPAAAGYKEYSINDFVEAYPFFQAPAFSKAPVYPAKLLIGPDTVHFLKDSAFRAQFDRFSSILSSRLRPSQPAPPDAPFVHRLPLDRDFLNYLRLFAGIKRIGLEEALFLKNLADEELARFRKSL